MTLSSHRLETFTRLILLFALGLLANAISCYSSTMASNTPFYLPPDLIACDFNSRRKVDPA